jgi:hypothetical protein
MNTKEYSTKYIINGEQKGKLLWLVDFVGEYAEMNTWVYADDENDACVVATNFMIDYYGVDMDKFQTVASECVSL